MSDEISERRLRLFRAYTKLKAAEHETERLLRMDQPVEGILHNIRTVMESILAEEQELMERALKEKTQ